MVGRKGNILIVDDHPDNLRTLSAILSEWGYKIRKATDGEMALETIRAEPPDLVLLDVQMPRINGYTVCLALKAEVETAEIPVIFLSALDDTVDKVKGFGVGGADYITKPFQAEEVLARIRHQLTIRQQQQALNEKNQQLQQEIWERKQAEAALHQAHRELQRLVNIDGLTQIANRRYFDEMLQSEWFRLQREQLSLSIVLCDVDYFKLYNDRYGHQAGDECLKQVAQTVHQTVRRPADLVARYGGEEFVIILPNTTTEGAMHVAGRIQQAIGHLQLPHPSSPISPDVTLSLGIASLVPNPRCSAADLLLAADRALYRAKAQGRNTYCVGEPSCGSYLTHRTCKTL